MPASPIVASPKPLADQLGYCIGMRLLFKPNVTCGLWTFSQGSDVKTGW